MGIRDTFEAIGVGILLLAVLTVLFLANTAPGLFVPSSKAVATMRAFGYRRVVVVGEHRIAPRLFGGCGRDDLAGFDVDVMDTAGATQHFLVCCNMFGACSMRTRSH
jgi:hypothetical protein